MEKQEKKKENKVEKIKVGKRRGKKEMNKLLTKKDVMDEAFRRIREMEKYREKSNVVDLSKVNDKAKDSKVNDKVKDEKKGSKVEKKVKENAKYSQSTKDSKSIKPTQTTQPTKRKSSGYIWVKKRNPTKESQTLKIYTNPLDRTRAALLDKLERKLNDYFSVVPEDLKKVNVLKVLQSLKGNKTITVSIGECSYIFEGEKMESNEKFKDPRIKEIISNMVKSLRNL